MFNKIIKGFPERTFIQNFLRIVVPIVLSEMLMIAVGFIDNFMIGNYGSDHTTSLASVAIANEILFFVTGAPMFFMTTFTIFLAQFMGSKDEERMRQSIKFWLTTSLTFSVIFSIVVASAAEPLVKIYNPNDADIIHGATNYVRTTIPAVIMMCVGFTAMTSAAITGRPKWTLILGIGSIIINIIGDYLLIYVADLGIIGSAIATDIARVYELTLAIIVFRKYTNINIFINFFHYDTRLFKKELRKITTAISQVAFSLSLVGLSLILSRGYGKHAQAALATGYALAGILWSVFPGIGTGVKVFVGKELGSNNFDAAKANVRKVGFSIPFLVTPIMIVGILFAMFLPGPLGAEGTEKIMARNMVITYSVAMIMYSYTSMNFGIMSAGGHVRASNIVQNYFQLFFIIPIGCLVIWGFGSSFTIAIIVTQAMQAIPLIISYILIKKEKWTNNLTIESM